MHRWGHVGASLLTYAPIGGRLVATGRERLALVGGAVAVTLATLPDVDEHLSAVEHRGPTHTLWFVLAVGAALGSLAGLLATVRRADDARSVAAVAGLAGLSTTITHVAADATTPMGIRPFAPLCDASVGLGLVRSRNRVANLTLLVLGLGATLAAVAAGRMARRPRPGDR